MAQKIMLSLAVFFCWTFALRAEEYKLSSPDKKLEVKLRVEGFMMKIFFSSLQCF